MSIRLRGEADSSLLPSVACRNDKISESRRENFSAEGAETFLTAKGAKKSLAGVDLIAGEADSSLLPFGRLSE